MHHGWRVGILLFFYVISEVVSATDKCPAGEFSGCTCTPPTFPPKPVIIRCINTTRSNLTIHTDTYTTRLEILDMSGSRINELKPMMLSGYGNVKTLVLKNNMIKNIDKAALDGQTSLTELDLRDNHIKTIPRGVFSQSKLRVLYLANNPFSCNDANLLEEIKDLMAGGLQVFDGEMLTCAEPAHMKGRKIIDVARENKASALEISIVVGGIASLLTSIIGATIIMIKHKRYNSKCTYNSLSSMEDGSVKQSQERSEAVDEQEAVAQTLQKLRRQSQGYPANGNTESEDEDVKDQERK